MTKLHFGAALAALAATIPVAAPAQRIGPAVVAVVDTDRISRECTACRAAATQLQAQANALRTRQQQLQQQLQTQGQPLEQALQALNGRQPDAALQQRVTAFQQQQNTANQELQRSEQTLRSTTVHVQQQIAQRLQPVIANIAQARGATVAVDRGSTLFSAPGLDITNDVLAQLNQQLPSVSVTPLPQQQQTQQQPTGR